MIDRAIIEEIKFRNPIEDVISSYVTLSKSGNNLKGLCPFHSEKTPSFTVFTGNGGYYCFGCGAGGDVISFIMKIENLDYVSAIEFLARRVGITIPDSSDDKARNRGVTRSRVIEMNVCAARFFRDMLFDEKIGAPAREYLAKRQLSAAIVRRFGLGYAPNSFNALRDHLKKNGFTDEELKEGFMCGVSRKDERHLYDYFRNRLMFPIIDVSGNILAFSGRVLDDGMPKYLNTSDTPAFKKSKVMFGLNFAKNNCADGLILCEGNVDVVSLHEAGFENAVATLGTAITPEHARLMKKYTDRVTIAYDGDAAGRRATEKAVKILEDVGLDAKVLTITGAKDPDEYIKKYGKEAFRKLIGDSRSVFDYTLEGIIGKYNLKNDEEKAKAAKELCAYAAGMYSRIERDIFVAKMSAALGIEKASIEYDVSAIIRRNKTLEEKKRHQEVVRETSGITDRVNRDFARFPRAARLEEMVLGMMLSCPEFIKKVYEKKTLSEEDFSTEYGKKLFGIIIDSYSEAMVFDTAVLSEKMTGDEVSRAFRLMADRMKLQNTDEIFDETSAALKKETSKKAGSGVSSESLDEKIRKKRGQQT